MKEPSDAEIAVAIQWCQKNGWGDEDGDPLARAYWELATINGARDAYGEFRELAKEAGVEIKGLRVSVSGWFDARASIVLAILERMKQ